MATKRNFIKEFWKEKRVVGAISPSTRFLGEKMVENVNFDEAKLIIELGPGTGVFTDQRPDAVEIVKVGMNDIGGLGAEAIGIGCLATHGDGEEGTAMKPLFKGDDLGFVLAVVIQCPAPRQF